MKGNGRKKGEKTESGDLGKIPGRHISPSQSTGKGNTEKMSRGRGEALLLADRGLKSQAGDLDTLEATSSVFTGASSTVLRSRRGSSTS